MLPFNPARAARRRVEAADRRAREKDARRAVLMASPGRKASMGPAELAPAPKVVPVEHEGYRRLVALLPCKVCGVPGYSQAAHPNTGKGAGTKTDDRLCFPLCCDRPGVQGCHPKFDQAALFPKDVRRNLETAWARDTQRQVQALGIWPKDLPLLETQDDDRDPVAAGEHRLRQPQCCKPADASGGALCDRAGVRSSA